MTKTTILWLLAMTLLAIPMAAQSAVVSITPSTDPGNLKVGDTLAFTASISPITPPPTESWYSLVLIFFRVTGGSGFNFTGACADLSGLPSPLSYSCTAGTDGANWEWYPGPFPPQSQTISGDLFTFTAGFDQPGTYDVYLESATAHYVNATGNSLSSETIDVANTRESPIVLNVAARTVPEPATIALFGIGLAGLGFSRRRKRA